MKRVAIPVETDELCMYGCGNKALYKNGSGNLMCKERHNSCPALRTKNKNGVTQAHKDGKIPGWSKLRSEYGVNTAWNKNTFSVNFVYGEKGNHKGALLYERGHRCQECNNTEWLGVPITLELEHIDGDRKNNVRDNLKLLCPNCHSQTPTWRRGHKPGWKKKKYTDNEIIESVKDSYNLNQVLDKLDLRYGSAGTIIDVMSKYLITFKPK